MYVYYFINKKTHSVRLRKNCIWNNFDKILNQLK